MYGRTLNEDFAPLVPGTKAYKQAKNARMEMLEGFEAIRKDAIKRGLVKRVAGRKLPNMGKRA